MNSKYPIIINKIRNHKKHKPILLNHIEDFKKEHDTFFNNITSDWGLPVDLERKHLDYFYSDVIEQTMLNVTDDLGHQWWTITNAWFQQYNKNEKHKWHNHVGCQFTNCYFFDGRLSKNKANIIENIAVVSQKLLKIQQVELAYKTIPNIYTNLVKNIENIKLERSSDLKDIVDILQAHLTWVSMGHFTFEKAQSFEFNKNSIGDRGKAGNEDDDNYNIATMTEVISKNKYFIKCLVYSLQEQAKQEKTTNNITGLKTLLDVYDNIDDLLGANKQYDKEE